MNRFKFLTHKNFDEKFKKLDRGTQILIKKWIDKNLIDVENPRSRGKALTGNLKGLWRYRVENYRLICEIKDNELIIIAISIGHRSIIYKKLEK